MSKESAKSCRRLKEWSGQLLGPFPVRWRYFEKGGFSEGLQAGLKGEERKTKEGKQRDSRELES